jgi:thioredoxin-like negative regulator of GroEL
MMSKVIDGAKDKITVPIVPIDVDEQPDMAKLYGVRGVPTMVLVDDDREIRRKVGMVSEADLLKFLDV